MGQLESFESIAQRLPDVAEVGRQILSEAEPFGVDMLLDTAVDKPRHLGEVACVDTLSTSVDDASLPDDGDFHMGFDFAAPASNTEAELTSIY